MHTFNKSSFPEKSMDGTCGVLECISFYLSSNPAGYVGRVICDSNKAQFITRTSVPSGFNPATLEGSCASVFEDL